MIFKILKLFNLKTLHIKKHLLFLFFSALFFGVSAQTPNVPWTTEGNAGTDESNFLGTTDYTPLIFKTNDEERMRLLPNSSFLGIGTPEPNSPLHLHVETQIGRTIPLNLSVDELTAQTITVTGNSFLKGDVGIGNASLPLRAKFQIGDIWTFHDGSANKIIGRNSYWNGSNYVRIQQGFASQLAFNNTGDLVFQTAPDGSANSNINTWNTITFKNDGSVGIGATDPQAKLNVAGAFKAQSANITGNTTIKEGVFNLSLGSAYSQNLSYGTSYIGFNATRNNGNWAFVGDGANNGGAVIWNTVSGTINFASIPSTGTGAKTLTDTDIKNNIKLQLTSAGVLKAKKVQVTLTGWPDYVFDKEYELLSLSEVAQFIDQNSCLPNIPSAREVEENGLDIGEMQSKLLQKIEELTLYIIQLEKRLSEIENRKGGE